MRKGEVANVLNAYLIAGVLASVAGLVTFLVIHHVWIKPIWFILPVGLLIGCAGGLAVGWSYSEIVAFLPPRPWTALCLIALIALILAPSVLLGQTRPALIDTATASVLPGEGLNATIRFVLELVLTSVLVGGLAGWLIARSPTAAFATAAAGLAFALGPGHNIPLLGNTPGVFKGLVLLSAITAVAAVVLVETAAWLTRR